MTEIKDRDQQLAIFGSMRVELYSLLRSPSAPGTAFIYMSPRSACLVHNDSVCVRRHSCVGSSGKRLVRLCSSARCGGPYTLQLLSLQLFLLQLVGKLQTPYRTPYRTLIEPPYRAPYRTPNSNEPQGHQQRRGVEVPPLPAE